MNIFKKLSIFINGKEISGVDSLDDVKINTITGNRQLLSSWLLSLVDQTQVRQQIMLS